MVNKCTKCKLYVPFVTVNVSRVNAVKLYEDGYVTKDKEHCRLYFNKDEDCPLIKKEKK